MMAKQRAEFEAMSTRERTDFQSASTKERADFASFMEKERAKLENERLSLQKLVADERAKHQKAIEKERAELAAKRTELEKSVADQKAELERIAALDRKKIDELRAELKRRGEAEIERKRQAALEDVDDSSETELDEEELATPLFIGPNLVPIEPLSFNESNEVFEAEPVVFEPERAEPDPEPERLVTVESVKPVERTPAEGTKRNRWLIPGAVGGGVAVVGLIALAIATHGSSSTPDKPVATQTVATRQLAAPKPVAPAGAQWAVPLPAPGQVTDSAAGSIAPRADSVAAPAAATPTAPAPDSVALARAAAARAAARAERQREAEREAQRAEARRATQSQADTIFNFRPAATRPDSARPVRDSVAPVKRDSVTPPDTIKPRRRR
jgi:hypothetical protein